MQERREVVRSGLERKLKGWDKLEEDRMLDQDKMEIENGFTKGVGD